MTATNIRSVSEIQDDITATRAAFDRYNAAHFEGHSDPDNCHLNPHFSRLQELSDELYDAEQAEKMAKLSGDSLQSERAWFNSQGFTSPAVAQKACKERGYNLSDLMAAVKAGK